MRTRTVTKVVALGGVTLGACVLMMSGHGCAQPECATMNYADPECRVIVENELARHRVSSGMTLRFVDEADPLPWVAGGLIESTSTRQLRARIAGPGPFRLVADGAEALEPFELVLDNVDPASVVTVTSTSGVVPVEESVSGLHRVLRIAPSEAATELVIEGSRPCPSRFRFVFLADIQTNVTQFDRILERLQLEAEDAAAQGEPLLGIAIAGDLTETAADGEYEEVAKMLARAPVPVAVTAGNHDVFVPWSPHYNRTFGPGNYTSSVCGLHLAMLDTGNGYIAASVQARLPELFDGRGAEHIFAVMHHPPFAAFTGAGWSREDQAQALLAEATLAGVDVVVAGHYHGLRHFEAVPVGGDHLREVIVGTAGAYQGLGVPRYGYLRVMFDGPNMQMCFVEVPPPGYSGPANEPEDGLAYCP